jgi:hypothetical protein
LTALALEDGSFPILEDEMPADAVEDLVAPTNNDGLCSQCANLDIGEVYRQALIPSRNDWSEMEDIICSLTLSLSCRLCKLFAHCAPSPSPSTQADKFHISPRRVLLVHTRPEYFDSRGATHIRKHNSSAVACIGVIVTDNELEEEAASRYSDSWRIRRFFLYQSSSRSTNPFASLEHVDFGLLKSWLHSCKSHTGLCAIADEFNGRPQITTYLIDCKSLDIVPWDQQARYVALSYVW